MPSNRRLLSPPGRTGSPARGSYNFCKRSLRRSRCEHGGVGFFPVFHRTMSTLTLTWSSRCYLLSSLVDTPQKQRNTPVQCSSRKSVTFRSSLTGLGVLIYSNSILNPHMAFLECSPPRYELRPRFILTPKTYGQQRA